MRMRRVKSPIRELRERRAWRAADLAAFAGMSLGAVTMTERGELAKLHARPRSQAETDRWQGQAASENVRGCSARPKWLGSAVQPTWPGTRSRMRSP